MVLLGAMQKRIGPSHDTALGVSPYIRGTPTFNRGSLRTERRRPLEVFRIDPLESVVLRLLGRRVRGGALLVLAFVLHG